MNEETLLKRARFYAGLIRRAQFDGDDELAKFLCQAFKELLIEYDEEFFG